MILALRETLQLFFCFILLVAFCKAWSYGISGMFPNDFRALTELKLYDTNPDIETLLSPAETGLCFLFLLY